MTVRSYESFFGYQFKVGEIAMMHDMGTNKIIGRAEIVEIRIKKLCDITDEEVKLHQDFSVHNLFDVWELLKTYYDAPVGAQDTVALIFFRVL